MALSGSDTFQPNLSELDFALSMWDLPELMRASGHSDDLADAIITEAARLAADVLFPAALSGDKIGAYLDGDRVVLPASYIEAYRVYCEAGWHGISLPTEYGGQGLPLLLSTAVTELFNTANIGLTMGLMPAAAAVALLHHYGTVEQKSVYIPKILTGAWTVTMAMTEPQAGTDLGAIKTRAFSNNSFTKLKGEKSLITFGDHEMTENIIHLVLARSPNGTDGTKGLSLYIAAKYLPDGTRNDIACVAIEKKIGLRGSPTATLIFGSVEGAKAELLGNENRGLEQMFLLMNRARLNVAVFGLASAEGARQAASKYVVSRIQGRDKNNNPVAIINYPDVRRMIASMTARTEACRYIAYYTASLIDRSNLPGQNRGEILARLDIMTPIAKAWCTEIGFDVASMGLQVHGGVGYIDDTDASRYFREARVHTIYEGTTGVHANDLIFRKLIRDEGVAISTFYEEMRRTGEQARAVRDTDIVFTGNALLEAIERCEATTKLILANRNSGSARLQANGAHFLMMLGTCIAAWTTTQAALIASQNNRWPAQMVRKKVRQARFFMQQVVPPAMAMSDAVVNGADAVLAVIEDFQNANSPH
jgi:acyl-CoA dehydrogenase